MSQQKQSCSIIFHEPRSTHSQPFLKQLKTLNIFQINIYQTILSLDKIKINEAAVNLQDKFWKPGHQYPTWHSQLGIQLCCSTEFL